MRPRFSLRALFLATTVAACICFWIVLPTVRAMSFIKAIETRNYEYADGFFSNRVLTDGDRHSLTKLSRLDPNAQELEHIGSTIADMLHGSDVSEPETGSERSEQIIQLPAALPRIHFSWMTVHTKRRKWRNVISSGSLVPPARISFGP